MFNVPDQKLLEDIITDIVSLLESYINTGQLLTGLLIVGVILVIICSYNLLKSIKDVSSKKILESDSWTYWNYLDEKPHCSYMMEPYTCSLRKKQDQMYSTKTMNDDINMM